MIMEKITEEKINLLRLEDIDRLSASEVYRYYKDYINPGMLTYLSILGYHKIRPVKSEGMYIYTQDGRKILDFSGGIGVLNHGHNHPRILKALKRFEEEMRPAVWKTFLSPYLAGLSKNLAEISPGDLNYSFFCNSGAEAIEGALKLAEKYFYGAKKDKFVHAHNSFHGKTHAALSISGIEETRKYFKLLDGCLAVTYGDIQAMKSLFASRLRADGSNDIIAVVLEPIHAEKLLIPPKGYLEEVSALCRQNNALLIIDEIMCGFGKTGKLFAFQHDNIIPDIYCISKSLGGGMATIAAYVAREHIFKKAYGSPKDCFIHSSTFNGFGPECIAAIEAINTLFDENLIENARIEGEYFLSRLEKLKERHSIMIKDVRGRGLLIGIELQKIGHKISHLEFLHNVPFINEIPAFLTAVIISTLLHEHNILSFSGQHHKEFISLTPPLIVQRQHIDYCVEALDKIFSTSIIGLCERFIARYIKNRLF